jgi:ribonuclease BN (tRNA processing enzyme)
MSKSNLSAVLAIPTLSDTNPTQATIDACNGCDVLIHEVLTLEWLAKRPDFHGYARSIIRRRRSSPNWPRRPSRGC